MLFEILVPSSYHCISKPIALNSKVMNNTKQFLLFTLVCLLINMATVNAQIEMPQPSPLSTVTQQVGLTKVTITYSRPSMKGRKIFGSLVPYGDLWRTGANAATKISFSNEMVVGGTKVPAGDYALFTIPGQKEWTIILNKNVNQGGTADYKQNEDAARFQVPASKAKEKHETFTLMFSDLTDHSAHVNLLWENTKVSFKIEDPNVEQRVMSQIKEQMKNPGNNAGLYFQAASYYFTNNKDLQQAQEWIDKAIELDGDKYWMLHLQAKIHAKNNNNQKAIAAAKKSMELAEKNGNMDYVRLNQDLIGSLK